ncbi:MAG: transposase [Candidatus Aureabacteria bacterium]|nr:transposase [Candidatus Auribacterota bacterium]
MNIIQKYSSKYNARFYHWCLMSNHYHLVTELKNPEDLTKITGGIQQVYAYRYHKKYGTAGKLFQGRFKSQAIEKENYLLICGRYVENNPVRAGLCQNAWDWPWSSAGFYIDGKNDTITLKDPLWKKTNGEDYKEWLKKTSQEEEKLFKSSLEVIGNLEYQRKLLKKKGRIIHRRKGRRPDYL